MTIYSYDDYVRDPLLAAADLGELLRESSLRLFLGAGVSNGFGLPSWKHLIARIVDKDGDATFMSDLPNKAISDLQKMVDPFDDGKTAYVSRVYGALYREVEADLLKQLQQSPLLLAVAAMMTGLHRGRIDSVVTYNYDDLLEQYLTMLGLKVCARLLPSDLSIRSDVEINYVHGRLEQNWTPSADLPELILSAKSYRERRAEIDKGWSALITHGFYSKIGLFVGLSGGDSAILDIMKRVQNRVERNDRDYTGYWIMTPDAFAENQQDIQQVGMCPIAVPKEQIPQFVFSICQHAAR